MSDSTLRHVIYSIANQVGLRAVYDGSQRMADRKVTTSIVNATVKDAYKQVLDQTGLEAMIIPDKGMVIIRSASTPSPRPDSGSIRGTIIDSATGKGLSGAVITIIGTKRSTVVDEKGSFTFDNLTPGDHTINVKLLGYQAETQVVTVTTREPVIVRIILKPSATVLSGVVTTVTGEQRKLEIGNSIATINVDSVIAVAPVSNLTDVLENRVPGLTVQRAGGRPGDPARIRLRGSSSINNSNDVIAVVDGVRVESGLSEFGARSQAGAGTIMAASPIDQIDINSIEKIDVFKGPSAAAMYGSDAANGVIVITTKRGSAGPSKWTASIDQGLSYIPTKFPEGVFRFGSMMGMLPARCNVLSSDALLCDMDSVVKYQSLNDRRFNILGTGQQQQYSANVSGGGSIARFAISASRSDNIGVTKMSEYLIDRFERMYGKSIQGWMKRPDRYNSLSLSNVFSWRIDNNVEIDFVTKLYRDNQKRTSLGNGGIKYFMSQFHSDTLRSSTDAFNESSSRVSDKLTTAISGRSTNIPWLPLYASIGLDRTDNNDKTYLPRGILMPATTKPDSAGRYAIGRTLQTQITYTAHSSFSSFSNRILTTVGLNGIHSSHQGYRTSTNSLEPGITEPISGFRDFTRSDQNSSFNGWFVEPRLNLNSSFFASPGFRLDQNGLQGGRAGLMRLPKINLSWLVTDFEKIALPQTITLLRLRMAAGAAGTLPAQKDRLRLYTTDLSSEIPDIYSSNLILSRLGNTVLKPERSTEYEVGGDLDLLDGRIGIEFTQYSKVRRDAIVSVPMAPSLSISLGLTTVPDIQSNIGVIKNSGNEITLRGSIVESPLFTFGGTLGFFRNINRVTKLNDNSNILFSLNSTQQNSKTVSRVVSGYPLWGIWAIPIVGYSEADQNGIISESEVRLGDSTVYLGQQDPKGSLSLSSYMTFLRGNISINMDGSFQYGMSQVAEVMMDANSPLNTLSNLEHPSLYTKAIAASTTRTGYGIVQQVDVWRLNSLVIRSVVPKAITSKIHARSASVALQGKNLFMKSKYMGMDPNVNSLVYDDRHVSDSGMIPPPRSWSIRITLGN